MVASFLYNACLHFQGVVYIMASIYTQASCSCQAARSRNYSLLCEQGLQLIIRKSQTVSTHLFGVREVNARILSRGLNLVNADGRMQLSDALCR